MPIMLPDWNEFDSPSALSDAVVDVLRRHNLPIVNLDPEDFDGPLAYMEAVRDHVNLRRPDADVRIPKDPAAQEETTTIPAGGPHPALPPQAIPESNSVASWGLALFNAGQHIAELTMVLRDYPKGQDDGTWYKRREAALAGLTSGQSVLSFAFRNGDTITFKDAPAPTPTQDECPDCAQVDIGQTGEHPCPACGLPQQWDDNPTTNLLNRLLSAGVDGVPYLNPTFKDRAEPAKAILALVLDQMTSPTDRHNGITVGQAVHVFDRYRFSKPLLATVVELSSANDGVQVQLAESNNPSYPVGSLTWVHAIQCRAAAGKG